MGNFLTFVMETLLKKEDHPKEQEIDHNVCVCCGSLNVQDHLKSDTDESDGSHEDTLCR